MTKADPQEPADITVHVDRATQTETPDDAQFQQWVEAAVRAFRASAHVDIRIVDRDESQSLNATYRDKDYPTNVLSFPAELAPEVELPLLGDLALCAPVVTSEAIAQEKQVMDHWAHLTVHGTLHLLGMDHQQDEEANVMEALEIKILSGLGIANPYSDISAQGDI